MFDPVRPSLIGPSSPVFDLLGYRSGIYGAQTMSWFVMRIDVITVKMKE
jgi:hypothetical protein